jgi:hypothetical protein
MAFTVSRRTAEIGIRLALGATAGRVVLNTFGRALAQVGLGVLVGAFPRRRSLLCWDPRWRPAPRGRRSRWPAVSPRGS